MCSSDLLENIEHRSWDDVRDLLAEISSSRAKTGSTPSETATFVFSLKQPVFALLRSLARQDPEAVAEEMWKATTFIDRLALYTTEVFSQSREAIIARQQEEMLELSTPVVELWDGILTLPIVGMVDSQRAAEMTNRLLEAIRSEDTRLNSSHT